jgi:heat shock protein HslJ
MALWHRLTAAAATALALTSCQAEREAAAESIDLAGTAWVAESIAGLEVTGEPPSFIRFDDGRQVSGHAGCNGFTGTYEMHGDRLVMGPLAVTRRACGGVVDDQERRFLAAVSGVDRYEIEDDLLLLYAVDSIAATRLALKME